MLFLPTCESSELPIFFLPQGASGRLPSHRLKPISCQRRGGKKKKMREEPKFSTWVCLARLGRHRDALGIWVVWRGIPARRGLEDEQGEMSPPQKPGAGHFLEQASSIPGADSGVTLDPWRMAGVRERREPLILLASIPQGLPRAAAAPQTGVGAAPAAAPTGLHPENPPSESRKHSRAPNPPLGRASCALGDPHSAWGHRDEP